MYIVDCRKCPLSGCCKNLEGYFQNVNNCPLAHTVWTQVKDWAFFSQKEATQEAQ